MVAGWIVSQAATAQAQTFPAETGWIPLTRSGVKVGDPIGDSTGGSDYRDLVGDATYPAAYFYQDSTHMFFRVRVSQTPLQTSDSTFKPFGWACFVRHPTSATTNDDYISSLNGTYSNGGIQDQVLWAWRSVQSELIATKADVTVGAWEPALPTYARATDCSTLVGQNSNFGGDGDWFVDWAVPLATVRAGGCIGSGCTPAPGLAASSTIYVTCGTSNNGFDFSSDPLCDKATSTCTNLSDAITDPFTCDATGCVKSCTADSECGTTTSGKVCTGGPPASCQTGCRGTGGNGCAVGFVCTSTTSAVGSCVADTDGDGISDTLEGTLGTDPTKKDSDGDGIQDNVETSPTGSSTGPYTKVDTDGDGVIDALDLDSDDDCKTDATEPTTWRNKIAPSTNSSLNCSGTTPICNDPLASNAVCSACNGDYGTLASLSCFSTNPYCVTSGATAGTCGKCTTNADCVGHTSGPYCEPTSGACSSACTTDSQCLTSEWCNTGTCSPKLANGTLIPSVAGTCTSTVAARVCTSATCSTTDNKCGLIPGETCGGGTECRSTYCSGAICVSCTADSQCGSATSGQICTGGPAACAAGCRGTGGNGCAAGYLCTSTTSAAGTCEIDTDGDGISDVKEGTLGTDPTKKDSDGDGLFDNEETSTSGTAGPFSKVDTDGDGTIDALDTDSDNDCVLDATDGSPNYRDATKPSALPSANCSGTTPLCNTASGTCTKCGGDYGTTGTFLCPVGAPYCALTGTSAGSCGKCLTNTDCAGHAGTFCNVTSGACESKCSTDAQCLSTQWCETGAGVCTAKLPNGDAIPGTVGGTCTTALGTRVCTSGVCSTTDNKCGIPGGGDCTLASTCRGAFCTDGKCGSCAVDTDCGGAASGKVCTGAPLACVDGCRGTGGNACPTGYLCSSKTSTVGTCDKDTDGDGVIDSLEATLGTNPALKDTDGDGIQDNVELSSTGAVGPFSKIDTDGDGTIDALDSDSDNDCASDVSEGTAGYRDATKPNTRASDNCGGTLPICNTMTAKCVACTEDAPGTAATACSATAPYCFLSGTTAGACGKCTKDADCSGHAGGPFCDTVSGACGSKCATDAQCKTTEYCSTGGVCSPKLPSGDPLPSPVKCTTEIGTRYCIAGVCSVTDDRCGLPTGEPCAADTACRTGVCDTTSKKCVEKDTDGDGIPDVKETELGTDPTKKDSDGDGIPDNVETSATGSTGPYIKLDTDGDGTIDALDTDSDGDSVLDSDEGAADVDSDGKPNYRDTDDDDDGILTKDEVDDAKSAGVATDLDGDGKPNYYDTDADGDGYLDKNEGRADTNGNSKPEYLDPYVEIDAGPVDSGIDAGPADTGPELVPGSLEGGGCGCTTPGSSNTSLGLFALAGAFAGLSAMRRRRR